MKAKDVIKNISDVFEDFRDEFEYWLMSLINWFLAEVGYTLLPILVIVFIKSYISRQIDFLYLSPEWSFATIVTFGVAITSAIELKTEYQKDTSNRIYVLTRMLIITMIFAVLVLGLVVIRADGLEIIDDAKLSAIQITLFVLSVFALLQIHVRKEQVKRENEDFPKKMSLYRYYDSLTDNLIYVNENLILTKLALMKRHEMKFNSTATPRQIEDVREYNRDLAELIQRVKRNLDELTPFVEELPN